MEVNSISSFNVSLISGRQIIVTWTNPIQALGLPYSGVYIRYQTGSYPTPNSGTIAYKGVGSNSTSGAQSSVTLTLPNLSTTYFLTCYSYCITSNGELLGGQWKASVATGGVQFISFTSNQNYTIPSGYVGMEVFGVGGGGGGNQGYSAYGGGGAGGGYCAIVSNVAISPGNIVSVSIGAGGLGTGWVNNDGGSTIVSLNGIQILVATGGKAGNGKNGGNGGSGGGAGAATTGAGAWGGSNGDKGGSIASGGTGGTGQGWSTYYNGIPYAGGGSGGSYNSGSYAGATAGGGGSGGPIGTPGGGGAYGTGGGGGGGGYDLGSYPAGGNGGSGVVVLKLY